MSTKRKLTEAAIVSTEIRKILKTNFPKIKFSVRSRNFSMGDSVDISWSYGPTENQVNSLVSKFKAGKFNSYEDIYEFNEDKLVVNESGELAVQPTAKYISTRRDYSISAEMYKMICDKFKVEYVNQYTYIFEMYVCTLAYRMINQMSFDTDNIRITDLEEKKQCGLLEDLYTFKYEVVEPQKTKVETPAAKKEVVKPQPVAKVSFFSKLLQVVRAF